MKTLVIIFISFILFSCAPTSQYQSNESETDEWLKKDVKHTYRIYAWDVDGKKGIPNAKIEVNSKKFGFYLKDTTAITNDSGYVNILVPTNFELWRLEDGRYKGDLVGYHCNSEINFKVSKEGYYTNFGADEQQSSFALLDKSYNALSFSYASVKLLRPIDYFSDEFLNSSVFSSMKDRVLGFIDILLLQSIIQDARLETRSIKTSVFKEKNYLSLALTSINVFNSLKISKYDIGKKLFDDIVRKILNPLNDNLALVKELYGYDLVINGYTKSIADEKASNTKIEYRFYIPKDIVAKYKNKDISGQQLLDNSIILMDDERVDFKLQ